MSNQLTIEVYNNIASGAPPIQVIETEISSSSIFVQPQEDVTPINIQVYESTTSGTFPIQVIQSEFTGVPIFVEVQEDYAPVQSVNGKIGWVVIDKNDVGLSNVENVSITGVSGYFQKNINNLSGYANTNYVTKISGQFLTPPTVQGTGFILNEGNQIINGNLNVTGNIKRSNINVSVVPKAESLPDTDGWMYIQNNQGNFEFTYQLQAERNVIYNSVAGTSPPRTRYIRLPNQNNLAGDTITFATNGLPPQTRVNFYKYDPGLGWVLIDSWGNSSLQFFYYPFNLSLITYQDSANFVPVTSWQILPSKWRVNAPTGVFSPGVPGDLSFDGTHLYVCVQNNEWRRSTASTWS